MKILKEPPARLWYLSFAQVGGGFRGGLYLWASNFGDAISGAWASGQNPGGEVIGVPVPEHSVRKVPRDHIGRLLTKEEIDQEHLGHRMMPIRLRSVAFKHLGSEENALEEFDEDGKPQ